MKFIKVGVLLMVLVITYLVLSIGFLFALTAIAAVMPHGVQHAAGIDTQTSPQYGFTSGFGPMVISMLGYSTIVLLVWRHLTCHQDGCNSIGRFPVAGGQYKTCRSHHPDPEIREKRITADHLHKAHQAHLRGLSR